MSDIFRIAWERFGLLGSIIGDVQARTIVTVFYFTIVVPFGVGYRLLADPMRQRDATPTWEDRPAVPDDLDNARQQG